MAIRLFQTIREVKKDSKGLFFYYSSMRFRPRRKTKIKEGMEISLVRPAWSSLGHGSAIEVFRGNFKHERWFRK